MLPGVTLKTFVVTDYPPDTANTEMRCGFSCLLCVGFVSVECGRWYLEAGFVVHAEGKLTCLDLNLTCGEYSVLP